MKRKQILIKRIRGITSFIIIKYLKRVEKFADIIIENGEMLSNNSIAVFWHRDSCTMNLVLSYLKKKNFKPIVVVITADPRGDYIEAAIKKFGAESIRIDFNAFDVKEYKNFQ